MLKENKNQKNDFNLPYIEKSIQEYSGVLVRYEKIYYEDYRTYFSGLNTLANFSYEKDDRSLHFMEIVSPKNGDYVDNAESIIDKIPIKKMDYVHYKYLVIGMTISIIVSRSIAAAVGSSESAIKKFYSDLYLETVKRFPQMDIINAYANPSKCLLVIMGVPYRLRSSTQKRQKSVNNHNKIYISFSKIAKDVPKVTLAKELFSELEKKPFYKKVLEEQKKIGTPEWCNEKILRAYQNHDLSLAALGLYVNLIYEKDIESYNNKMIKITKNVYSKCRRELIEQGYAVLINTNTSNSDYDKNNKHWELKLL